MTQKKICTLGTSAVGKSSLVARFVKGIFSDQYLTTIGVKIDKKTVTARGQKVDLLIWDLNGEDRFQKLSMNYLRGTAGYLLVIDGTRRSTMDAAIALHHKAQATIGDVPFVVLINKADISSEWEVREDEIAEMRARGWNIQHTSARTGAGVEKAFIDLAHKLV
ncbi:MAG: Rab family GTPase [Rhodothermales bacterium]|nr:Rab family GTPase [Rhodothermales bacterium]